jgi:hypothetical protein
LIPTLPDSPVSPPVLLGLAPTVQPTTAVLSRKIDLLLLIKPKTGPIEAVVGAASNNHIVVGTTANGGVQISTSERTFTFDRGYLQSVTIGLGGGANSVQVVGVPAGVRVNVEDTARGTDTVTVGNGTLAAISGPVNVSNSGGRTSLTIDDSRDTASRVTTITNRSVQVSGLSPVNYSGKVVSLQVKGGSGADSYFINSTAPGTSVSVVTGAGRDSVFVGSGSLGGLAAAVSVQANPAGKTTLVVDDFREGGRGAVVTSTSVAFGGAPAVSYSGVSAVDVVGSEGHNTVRVDSVPSGVPVVVYNTAHNTVTGAAAPGITRYAQLPIWDINPVHVIPLSL